jgi:hypothetical protein
MTALFVLTGFQIEAESLKPILIFCGVGLVFSLFAIDACGLDLSTALF